MTDPDTKQLALEGFDLFRSDTRIQVIQCLQNTNGLIDCTELTGQIAGRSPRERSLEINLHHFHLPALDEAGIINYDHQECLVTDFDQQRLQIVVEATQEVLKSI